MLFAVALAAGSIGFVLSRAVPTPRDIGEDGAGGPAPPLSQQVDEPVSAVAKAVSPSVVQIETDRGLGSGVVYDRRGLLLTAAHVVEGQTDVTVRVPNGRRLPAKVVGADDTTDVAVVRVASAKLRPASLALGRPVQVGQLAVAIGSPFGLEGSVTSGVVSAVDRTVGVDGGTSLANMIQTDASINPGNSGGALADRRGAVIGINDAIKSTSGTNQGIGFAIPIDTAASVADALVKGKTPRVGFLGITGADPANGPAGALVTSVRRGTAAANVGIRPGDVITAMNGERIEGIAELASLIRRERPGSTVTLELIKNGKKVTLNVRIGGR